MLLQGADKGNPESPRNFGRPIFVYPCRRKLSNTGQTAYLACACVEKARLCWVVSPEIMRGGSHGREACYPCLIQHLSPEPNSDNPSSFSAALAVLRQADAH